MSICTRMSADTTQKYLSVARCDGVAFQLASGSQAGTVSGSAGFSEAYHQTIAQMPASSIMMLTPVHSTVSPVGRLPINGSYGQLCVYVMVSFGRFVDADQEVQKIKAASCRIRSGLLTVPAGIA